MEVNTIPKPEGGTPQAPAPVAQTTVQQPQQPATIAPKPQTQTGQAEPATQLPTGTSERTAERFEKLTESNKRLFDANQLLQQELARKQQVERQFQPVQQTVPQDQQPKIEDYIETDQVTGEQTVNSEKLNKALLDAQSRASRAEQAVKSYIDQQDERERLKQTEEAYKAYPELNPTTDKFDAALNKRTRAFLLDSMVNSHDYNGRPLTFKEAADLAKAQLSQPVAAPVQTAEPKKEEGKEAKEQASLEAQGISSTAQQAQAAPNDELEQLRQKTRRGDYWAIAQRLKNVTHTASELEKES